LQKISWQYHYKVAANIKTTALPQNLVCDDRTKHDKNLNWKKATQQQKLKYQQTNKIWISEMALSEELTLCENPVCKNQEHISMLEQFYTDIVVALTKAASVS